MMLGNAFAAAASAKNGAVSRRTKGPGPNKPSKPNARTKRRTGSAGQVKVKVPSIVEDNHCDVNDKGARSRRSNSGDLKETSNKTPDTDASSFFIPEEVAARGIPRNIEIQDGHRAISHHKSLSTLDNVSLLTEGDFRDPTLPDLHMSCTSMDSYAPMMNSLFTFRRAVSGSKAVPVVRETTLAARLAGQHESKCDDHEKEETMADLVKRLQEMAKTKASGVLRFPSQDRLAIKSGEKRIVFILPQIHNAPRFSTQVFGRMISSELLRLTPERPVCVDIETEDIVVELDEAVELF